MIILGIETSCDETACALVENGRKILSSVIFSQIKLHEKTGGIVPEVAAREHAVKIIPVLRECLQKAKIKLEQIDGIAVVTGPGLLSSLLIGVNAGSAIAWILKKPLIPVNHIEGHIYANVITRTVPWRKTKRSKNQALNFPIAVLTASGGHNDLILWKGHGKYRVLGETLDDAAGEAFDKVGKLLDLPYPGGPEIEKIAKKGNPEKFPLPLPYPVKNFNFSFSGIKTAVLYLLKNLKFRKIKLSEKIKADIAASFQKSVCEVLAEKLVRAAEKFRTKEIHLAGGVSANRFLINLVKKKITEEKLRVKFRHPPLFLCTDNGAMIAAAGFYKFHKFKNRVFAVPDPNLPVKNW